MSAAGGASQGRNLVVGIMDILKGSAKADGSESAAASGCFAGPEEVKRERLRKAELMDIDGAEDFERLEIRSGERFYGEI